MNKADNNIDNQEFIKLIEENKLKLYKTAMAILKNQEDANDAIQDTLLSSYKNIHQLKSREYFTTWMITILRNKCFDLIKKNKKSINLDDTVFENKNDYYDEYKVESSLERTINKLDGDLKEMTIYYYYDELSIKEISMIMSIPEGTVKSRLSRAREKLKIILEQEEGDN